jgi:hypothetical protein
MATAADLLIGEFVRTLDERFRLAIPPELVDPLLSAGPKIMLAKERAGCLSLWSSALWKPRLDAAVDVVRTKLQAGLLTQRMGQVQELGRLLSTRQQTVSLAGRSAMPGWRSRFFPVGSIRSGNSTTERGPTARMLPRDLLRAWPFVRQQATPADWLDP